MAATIYGLNNANDEFEKKTIKKVAECLYDDWSVLVPPRPVGSDCDIAVLNKSYLALIEIKASDLKWQNGSLEQLNRAENEWHPVDPIKQLERVFRLLKSKKDKYFETDRFLPKNFFLCTPESFDSKMPDLSGGKGKNFAQISKNELNENLGKLIVSCSDRFQNPLNKRELEKLRIAFGIDADESIDIAFKDEVGVVQKLIKDATTSQKRVLEAIGKEKMFSVIGGAGTGKTFLAMNLVQRRVKEDASKHYIFACFTNRLSNEVLRKHTPKKTFVGTISKIINQIGREVLHSVDIDYGEFKKYISQHKNMSFSELFETYEQEYEAFVLNNMLETSVLNQSVVNKYETVDEINFQMMKDELLNILEEDSQNIQLAKEIRQIILDKKISLDNEELKKYQYDGIICDEGQDISPPWFLFLSQLVTNHEYEVYIFYDMNQKVLGKSEFKLPLNMLEINLNATGNCRSTDQISVFANLFLEDESNLVLRNIEGPNVEINAFKDIEFLCQSIDYEIKKLLDNGIEEKQIAILYDKTSSDIANAVSNFFNKKYLYIQQDRDDRTGNIDSIRRFKGLERNCVFLVLNSSDLSENKKLIYVGSTRASEYLFCMIMLDDDYDIDTLKQSYNKKIKEINKN